MSNWSYPDSVDTNLLNLRVKNGDVSYEKKAKQIYSGI